MSTFKPKRAYHHGNLRETLIEIGIETLEAGPATEVSLRDLARQAGVSPNAVYRHFAGKDDLLAALATAGFRLLRSESDEADRRIDPADGRERLRAYGICYIRAATRRPALFRLMFGRFAAVARDEELEEAKRSVFDLLRARVAANAHVAIDHPDVATGALYAWSLVHGFSNLALDGQIEGDVDVAIERVLAVANAGPPGQPRRPPN